MLLLLSSWSSPCYCSLALFSRSFFVDHRHAQTRYTTAAGDERSPDISDDSSSNNNQEHSRPHHDSRSFIESYNNHVVVLDVSGGSPHPSLLETKCIDLVVGILTIDSAKDSILHTKTFAIIVGAIGRAVTKNATKFFQEKH